MKHSDETKTSRRHAGFSRLETLILSGVGALCCVVLWPALAQNAAPNAAPNANEPWTDAQMGIRCSSNLKQIGLAFNQYTQDYDQKYPPYSVRSPQNGDDTWPAKDPQAVTRYTPVGWADAVWPYMKTVDFLQCPAEKHASSMKRVKGGEVLGMMRDAAQMSGFTDYWYNANLSQISMADIGSFAKTLLLGEGDGGAINSNARYTLNALPQQWLKAPRSPLTRHDESTRSYYCFADGHVAILSADKISNKAPGLIPIGEGTFEEGVGGR